MESIQSIEKAAEQKMQQAVSFLEDTLAQIRAGKANPRILDGVKIDYYGSIVPLSNVASINTPDAKTITVLPWEKNMLHPIEKAIINSDVGITPENNGEIIRLGIPPLTEERRKQLVKQSKAESENAKISIRTARRDAIEVVKKMTKDGSVSEDIAKDTEAKLQKTHDRFVKKVEEVLAAKEKEIMTV